METISAAKLQPPARTFSISRVLSQIFPLIGNRIGLFFGIALVPAAASAVIVLFTFNSKAPRFLLVVGDSNFHMGLWVSWWGVTIGIMPFILYTVMQGAFSYAVFRQLTNRSVTLEQCLANGLKRFPYLLATGIASLLLMYVGLLLLIIPGIIVLCFIWMAIPVCAVEQKGPFASIRRSYRLTSGNWLRILGLYFVVGVVIIGVGGMILSLPMGIALSPALVGGSISTGLAIVTVISTLIASLIMSIFINVLMAVLYFELRSAKENIALENLTDVFA